MSVNCQRRFVAQQRPADQPPTVLCVDKPRPAGARVYTYDAEALRRAVSREPCPLCTTPARRIHSYYERTLADLPWAQYRVRLQLRVRKWFCSKRHCRRRIFTERLQTITAPWARRTLRLAQRLVALGVALGGTAGVHLCRRWGLTVSPTPCCACSSGCRFRLVLHHCLKPLPFIFAWMLPLPHQRRSRGAGGC
jgi:zinc-finger of transposase IS204/IS1001/IS1096/IS1165